MARNLYGYELLWNQGSYAIYGKVQSTSTAHSYDIRQHGHLIEEADSFDEAIAIVKQYS